MHGDEARPKPAAPASPAGEAAPVRARTASASAASRRRQVPFSGLASSPILRATGGYLKAFWPIFAVVVVVATAAWAYSTITRPPAPADRYRQIEDAWFPQRDKAQSDIADAFTDFGKLHAGYKAYYDSTKGYIDALAKVSDWGSTVANTRISTVIQDGNQELQILQGVVAAGTSDDMSTAGAGLQTAEATLNTDIGLARVAFGFPAFKTAPPTIFVPPTPPSSPSPGASGSASPGPSGSASPGPSSSPGASPS